MKKQLILTSLIAVNALLLAGCVAPQESGPAPTTQISCRIPKIERLPETQEAQEKGGLEIAITPALYKSVRVNKTTTRQAEATLGVQLSFVGQDVKNKVYVEQVTTPSLKPQPGRLEFEIRINNKLDRVFRAQGAVVQFNVAGKMIPFGY